MRRELGMFVALVLICLGLWWSNPDFFGHSNVLGTTRQIAMLGIFAIGIAFVIITGGIDLSIGSIVGLTGVLIAQIHTGSAATSAQSGTLIVLVALSVLLAVAIIVGSAHIGAGCIALLAYQIFFVAMLLYGGIWWGAAAVVGFAALLALLALVRGHKGLFLNGAVVAGAVNLYLLLDVAMGGGFPIWLAITVAMLIVLLIGLGQGMLITRLRLQPFIVTLGGMLMIRGISQTIAKGGSISFGSSPFRKLTETSLWGDISARLQDSVVQAIESVRLATSFEVFGHLFVIDVRLSNVLEIITAYPVLIFLVVVVLGIYLLHFTVFGRYLYAIGGNRDAAEYSGIAVKRIETLTYVISAGLGGVAGACYAAYIGQMSQNVGIAYELYAIAAAVLGGCSLRGGEGTIIGVVIGSTLFKVIENGINMFRWTYTDENGRAQEWRPQTDWYFIIIGAVIVIAVVLDQVVHLVQASRRTRRAAAHPRRGFDVVGGAPPPATS